MATDARSNARATWLNDSLLGTIYTLAVWGRGVFWRIARPTAIGVRALVVRGDEVLLICHRGGAFPWGLPGGGIKRRESLEEATRREVLEEAGCPVRVECLHGLFHDFTCGVNNYVAVYLCTPLADPRPPVGDIEIFTARYVSLRNLPTATDSGSRNRVLEYLRGETGLSRAW